ncbi:hypothetical protein EC968_001017 [Mortierella alpina]|nr:hypothetical protein EC968_001017 [Mortierella alpina]
MQAASHQIPRCVLAQSFLDNLSQNTHSDSTADFEGQDRNTDLDVQYQGLVHANGPQGANQSRKTSTDLHTAFQHGNAEGTHHMPGIISNRSCARAEDDTLREGRRYHRYEQRELLQHLQRPPVHFQQQQQQQYEAGADQYLSSPEYPPQQPQPGYQRQTHHGHSPSSTDAGAYQHQHGQHQQQQRQQRIHAEMRHLESMFPPLHDSPLEESERGADTAASIVHTSVEQTLQKPLASRARQIHMLPPPIVIPKESPQHHPSNHKEQYQQQQREAHPTTTTKSLHPLPSPPSSTKTSPDSPSSLAIHLYVHHHHHHHSQGTASPAASLNTSSQSSDLASPSAPHLPSPSTPAAGSTPLPLTQDPECYSENDSGIASLPSPVSPSADAIPSTTPLVAPRPLAPLLPSLAIPTSAASISPPTPDENEASSNLPWFNHPQSLANASSSTSLSQRHLPPPPQPQPQLVSTQAKLPEQAQVQAQPPRRHRHYRPQLPDPTLSQQLLSTISSKDLARLYVHAAHHLHSHQPIRHYVLMKMIMTQAELAQFGRLRADMPRAPGPSTGAKPRQRIGFGSEANTGLGARPKVPSKLGLHVSTIDYYHHNKTLNNNSSSSIDDDDDDDDDKDNDGYYYSRQPQNRPYPHLQPLSPSPLIKKKKIHNNSEQPTTSKKKGASSVPWTQSLSSFVSLSSSALSQSKKRPLSLTLTLKTLQPQHPQIPRKSHSWYGTSPSRRFEEMELGEPLEEQPGDIDQEDDDEDCAEDDDDDDDDDDEEEEEEDEEAEENYWTALRRTNNRSQRGLTRSASSIELRQPHDLEHLDTTARSLSYKHHAVVDKQGHHRHQQHPQQQHKRLLYPLAIPLQPLLHQQQPSYPSSPNSTGHIHSLAMGKSKNARRRAGVPSSTATVSSLPSSPVQRRIANMSSSSSSLSTVPVASHSSWSSSWSFFAPESFGFSGLLMLSLFFCVLYLFEGTTHYYNLQSALLSIIL